VCARELYFAAFQSYVTFYVNRWRLPTQRHTSCGCTQKNVYMFLIFKYILNYDGFNWSYYWVRIL